MCILLQTQVLAANWAAIGTIFGILAFIITTFAYINNVKRANKKDIDSAMAKKADETLMYKEFEIRDIKINSFEKTLEQLNDLIISTLNVMREENRAASENLNKVAERLARGANKIEHLEKSVEDLEKKVYKKVS